MKKSILIASAAVSLGLSAQASAAELQVVPEYINAMCSESGPLTLKWGETGVPYAREFRALREPTLTLPAAPMGFTGGQAFATEWSDRIFQFQFTADDVGREAAFGFGVELNRVLNSQGWNFVPVLENDTFEASFSEVGATWTRPIESADSDTEPLKLELSLSRFGGNLVLGCARTDLLAAQLGEVLEAKLPAGTPRPPEPRIETPEGLTPTRCANLSIDPELQLEVIEAGSLDFIPQVLARSRYLSRLNTWKRWKIESSGLVSESEMMSVYDVSSDSFITSVDALRTIGTLMPMIERLEQARGKNDAGQMCLALVEIEDAFSQISPLTEAMQLDISAKLDTLAAKHAIDLN